MRRKIKQVFINVKKTRDMKKLFLSLFAALTMFFMVSCGIAESAKDGEDAAKEFAAAYQNVSGNPQEVVDLFNTIAQKYGSKYATDRIGVATYLSSIFANLDDKDPKAAGIFFGISLGTITVTNPAGVADTQKMIDGFKDISKDKAAFQSGIDEAVSWYTQAPAAQDGDVEEEAGDEQ